MGDDDKCIRYNKEKKKNTYRGEVQTDAKGGDVMHLVELVERNVAFYVAIAWIDSCEDYNKELERMLPELPNKKSVVYARQHKYLATRQKLRELEWEGYNPFPPGHLFRLC